MKLKLKLTKGELESLGRMAEAFVRTFRHERDFAVYSYVTALEGFVVKQGFKFVSGGVKQKGNRLTLSDMETLAFHHILRVFGSSGMLSPYDDGVIRCVLEAIERQYDGEAMRRMARFNV